MGIFQDSQLRSERSLRTQFSNPWLNFSATGTTFGSTFKGNNRFDVALAISSGRNKFNTNEIFNKRDSSTVALLEIQPKSNMPSLAIRSYERK